MAEEITENQVQIEWVPLTQAGILKVKLPEQTVSFLTELTDLILADDPELEGLAYDDRLAGQIKLGKQREIPLTEETKKSKAMSTFLTFSSNIANLPPCLTIVLRTQAIRGNATMPKNCAISFTNSHVFSIAITSKKNKGRETPPLLKPK